MQRLGSTARVLRGGERPAGAVDGARGDEMFAGRGVAGEVASLEINLKDGE